MQKVHKTFIFTIVLTLMFSGRLFAQDSPGESQGMHVIMENVEWPPAEYTDVMHAQLAEMRQVAENAEKEGRPEQAEQLRRRADNMEREIDERAGELEQDRIRRAEEQLEHLRNMTREAEEIVNNIRGNMARREMAMRIPEPAPIFRPFPERPGPGPEPQWNILIDIGNDIRELLAAHLDRTEELFHWNREQAEQAERKIQELSQENEHLRMKLREREESNRNLERGFRQQLEELTQRQRQELEQREREMRRQMEEVTQRQQKEQRERQMRQRLEEQVRREFEDRERQRQERRERREQIERQREELEIQSEPEVPIERPEEIEDEN